MQLAILFFDYILIRDVKENGIQGGTFEKNVYRTRDLSEITVNEGNHASLEDNQILMDHGLFYDVGPIAETNLRTHRQRFVFGRRQGRPFGGWRNGGKRRHRYRDHQRDG